MPKNETFIKHRFSIKALLRSFKYAFNGLKILIKEEHNARVYIVATILVIIAGLIFKISPLEWIAVVFAVGLVFAAEILNTSIENLADFISPDKHSSIKKAKDLAAAGVFVSAVSAIAIALFIFLPKILSLF